jgi:hypothetical protein
VTILFPRLSADVVVLSPVPLDGGHLRVKLVIRNTGLVPVRIGTLVGHSGGGADGWLGEDWQPDFFKSDGPTPEQSAARVVALKPGETWSIPSEWSGVKGKNGKVRLEMAYRIGPEFAARHRTWTGRVEAKPVVMDTK